jgi:hypothetical protein
MMTRRELGDLIIDLGHLALAILVTGAVGIGALVVVGSIFFEVFLRPCFNGCIWLVCQLGVPDTCARWIVCTLAAAFLVGLTVIAAQEWRKSRQP